MKIINTLSVIALTFVVATNVAFASGIRCTAGNLFIQVYNNTDAAKGTRSVSTLIVSDLSRDPGDHTLLVARDKSGYFTGNQKDLIIDVAKAVTHDALSVEDDELLPLGKSHHWSVSEIKTIELEVPNFDFNKPHIINNAKVNGKVTVNLIDKTKKTPVVTADCRTYTKAAKAKN